jgi:hypothetical protein
MNHYFGTVPNNPTLKALLAHLRNCQKCRDLETNTNCEAGFALMSNCASRAEIRLMIFRAKTYCGEE